MRVTTNGKVHKISKGHLAALLIDLIHCGIATEDLRDFDIEEMRRMQGLSRLAEKTRFHRSSSWRAKKDFQQRGCIDDDHWRSRPVRIASAGVMEGAIRERRSRRARSSSTVGRSATSRISFSK